MNKNKFKAKNNRTGIAVAPERAQQMVQGTQEFGPSSSGDETLIAQVRGAYAKEGAEVGTLPPPKDQRAFQQAAQRAPSEEMMAMFMDKVGARLAFERAGVRLYEALLSKHQAFGGFPGGPSEKDITHVCQEELEHFKMLTECIEQLGGDPTAVTPAADVQTTAGMGLTRVLTDPRVDLVQSLDAILVAELADNASWEMLVEVADQIGNPGIKERFNDALQQEQEHVQKVKGWLSATAVEKRMAA